MRIRTIKPGFWLHEGLAALSPMHRLLFIGLWQLADKEGRMACRPGRIRAALFPYDKAIDLEELIRDLEDAGLVQLYADPEDLEDSLLAIPGFGEHQRPHPKEPKSSLPPPPSREKKRPAVKRFSTIPSSPVGREGKGREGDLGSLENRPPAGPPLPPLPDDKFSTAAAFWAWFQNKRDEAGLVPEKPPHPSTLSAWWSEAIGELKGNAARLEAAAYAFAEDKFWQAAKPPAPFGAFTNQWRKYVPQEVPHVPET